MDGYREYMTVTVPVTSEIDKRLTELYRRQGTYATRDAFSRALLRYVIGAMEKLPPDAMVHELQAKPADEHRHYWCEQG